MARAYPWEEKRMRIEIASALASYRIDVMMSILKEGLECDRDPIGSRQDRTPSKHVIIGLFDFIEHPQTAAPGPSQFPFQAALTCSESGRPSAKNSRVRAASKAKSRLKGSPYSILDTPNRFKSSCGR